MPCLIRRKGNLYREKMNEILNDVQKNPNFSNYCTNKKLAESTEK